MSCSSSGSITPGIVVLGILAVSVSAAVAVAGIVVGVTTAQQ